MAAFFDQLLSESDPASVMQLFLSDWDDDALELAPAWLLDGAPAWAVPPAPSPAPASSSTAPGSPPPSLPLSSPSLPRLSPSPTSSPPPSPTPDAQMPWGAVQPNHAKHAAHGLIMYEMDERPCKRWFKCVGCSYFTDRLYHAKMHYSRIHVHGGFPLANKRRFRRTGALHCTVPGCDFSSNNCYEARAHVRKLAREDAAHRALRKELEPNNYNILRVEADLPLVRPPAPSPPPPPRKPGGRANRPPRADREHPAARRALPFSAPPGGGEPAREFTFRFGHSTVESLDRTVGLADVNRALRAHALAALAQWDSPRPTRYSSTCRFPATAEWSSE